MVGRSILYPRETYFGVRGEDGSYTLSIKFEMISLVSGGLFSPILASRWKLVML